MDSILFRISNYFYRNLLAPFLKQLVLDRLLQILLSLLVRFLVSPYFHLANYESFVNSPQLELEDFEMMVCLHLVHLLPDVVEQMRRVNSLHEYSHNVEEEREYWENH